MFIDKTEEGLKESIEETLRNILDTPFTIERIRWVDDFSYLEAKERNTLTYSLLKDVLTHQMWSEYPVIWGELCSPFDRGKDYVEDGMYSGDDYAQSKRKR